MKNIVILTILTLLVSCEKEQPHSYLTQEFLDRNEFELSVMYNDTHVKEFLEFVYTQNTKYRSQEAEVLENYGSHSKEFKDLMFMINKTDAENLVRVEAVLEKFGYPDVHKIGGKAASAPFRVIQNSTDFETQAKYFGMFYKSFNELHIKDFVFETYMDNMYMMKFREPFEMVPPYKWQDRIDSMIVLMDLKVLPEGDHEH